MNPITVPELDTLSSIEAALHLVHQSNGAPLQLAKDSLNKNKGALHDASRLQLYATWARQAHEPILHFHASNSVDSVVEEIGKRAPGLTAVRIAEGLKVGDVAVSRREALAGATARMSDTDDFNLSNIIHGRSIDLPCISGAKVQFLRPLFYARKPDAVNTATELTQIFKRLSAEINKQDKGLVPDDFWRASGSFAHELISNTQEHALKDHAGLPYISHVEGLTISWNELEEDPLATDFSGHERLQQFWEKELISIRSGATRAIRCLQLSFFDTGPGFASRATGKLVEDLELGEERKVIFKCLEKNFSTKSQAGAGSGIADVLSELRSIGGLIRIRTGRHSIFNVFEAKDNTDLLNFSDWTAEPLAPVTGAVITLLVPLRRS